jgi:PhzF family phenazine biosynthesis protein
LVVVGGRAVKKFKFKKIDAFASGCSIGNPAGAVYLGSLDEITPQEMQRIAGELKGFVSEVGYVWRIDRTTFGLRYYSSEREVEFCGHATIAILFDLIKNDQDLIKYDLIHIVTNKGKLTVENRLRNDDAVFITAPAPIFSSRGVARDRIAGAFRISESELSGDYPASIVNAGLETLIVPLRRLKTILSLTPSLEELKAFCVRNGVDIVIVFSDETADNGNRFRTRVFAPTFGYLEDPATGSGNAALGYYLIKNEKWDGMPITLEQNGNKDNPNIVRLITKHDESGNTRVLFGGNAVVRIQGEYVLRKTGFHEKG